MLTHRPIDADARLRHFAAAFEKLGDRLMNVEVVRNGRQAAAEILQRLDRDPGVAAPIIAVGARDARPAPVEPVRLVRLIAIGNRKFVIEIGAHRGFDLVEFGDRDDLFVDQRLRVDFDGGRMRLDPLVHRGLREHRLVGLIVTVTAIAEHVDDDRFLEALSELGCNLRDVNDGFGIVAVDVENRRFDHQRDVGAVGRRARVMRRRRETDLVVDDEMD